MAQPAANELGLDGCYGGIPDSNLELFYDRINALQI